VSKTVNFHDRMAFENTVHTGFNIPNRRTSPNSRLNNGLLIKLMRTVANGNGPRLFIN
jgi:hypothetical protein